MVNTLLLIQYIAYWAVFGLIHTVLSFKQVKSSIPLSKLGYRIVYNIIATITIIAIVFLEPSIFGVYLEILHLTGFRVVLAILVAFMGAIIAFLGFMAWDLPAFLGLEEETEGLNTKGIYAFSRHPVYIGAILIFVSGIIIEVNLASLSWLLGAGGYFVIGTIPEEWKLRQVFPQYKEYQSNVGRFFPWKLKHFTFLRNNLS